MKQSIPGIILFGFLLIPAFMWVTGFGQAADENRDLTEWADFDVETLRTAEAFAITEQAVVDRLPLRKEAARANSEILLRALNQASDPRVIPGSEGWLFYHEAVEQQCLTEKIDGLTAVVERTNAVITSTGRTLHMLVGPDKPSVYPEKLPTDICRVENGSLLQNLADDLPFVSYPRNDISTTRIADPTLHEPYFQWDTHWNQIGASRGAQSVVTSLSDGLWDDAAIEVTGTVSHTGDLAVMLGIERSEPAPQLSTTRAGVTSELETLDWLVGVDGQPVAGAARTQYSSSGPTGQLILGNTVLLHDSFGWSVIPQLYPYFESLQAVRYRPVDAASADVIRAADRVLLEFVQRDFHNAVVATQLDARFAEVLYPEMTSADWELATAEGIPTVTASPAPECSASYLVSDRPDTREAAYAVNGQLVVPRANTIKNAVFSPTGTWSIKDATDAILASVEVVSVCGDHSGTATSGASG